MLVDTTAGSQRYVEDCEVCCNPISICYHCDEEGAIESFEAEPLDQ